MRNGTVDFGSVQGQSMPLAPQIDRLNAMIGIRIRQRSALVRVK
jgi:hypothetical protein